MAAYAALVSLMNDLELIPNHPTHSFSFDDKQITSLSQTIHFLIDFMETYDSHGCTREAAQVLESQIADMALAAHDVIESHIVDQIHAGSTLGGKAISCFLPDLQKAIDDLEFVKREAMDRFDAKSGFKVEQHSLYSTPTSSEALTSIKNVTVGFDVVLHRLVDMLTRGPSSERVIPIVGMGGIGKTTLAQNAFKHSNLEHHFDLRIWATISQEYSLENILAVLLSSEIKTTTHENACELGEQLHKKLWGRRYFIVLDDIWSLEAWDKIQMFLPNNENGSRVVITTRLSNLAAHLSMSPFEMEFLDDDKSWELFCVNAFGEGEKCPNELEKIGKKIVRRCRGLPLSIIVIGGYLRRSSKSIECWEKVSNFTNPISNLGEAEQCLEIIRLSYEHMPARLKPCFLYMGICYEDEFIDASQLLRYWVVEGFLKPKEGRTLEEVAEDCLEDLIERNLILVREMRWDGKVLFCGVHDIVRELCLKICKQERFMCVVEDGTKAIATERLVVIPEPKLNSNMIRALESARLVRSLIRQRPWFIDGLVVEFRLVRVLANVCNMLLKKDGVCSIVPNFQQVNLRCLDLSVSGFISIAMRWRLHLPSSISLFWNLQTLIMNEVDLPASALYEIWEMSQLRHLQFDRVSLPNPIPCERSKQHERIILRNLHTLLGVVNLRLSEEVCERMPNIKKLKVKYDYNHDSQFLSKSDEANSYYCLHNLSRFNKLESVMCEFGIHSDWRNAALSFRFPSSITELCLWNCSLHWENVATMVNSLPHLGYLNLDLVGGSEWSFVGDEFPCLKVLKIDRCHSLINLNADSSLFPVLEVLEISSYDMSEIPSDFGEIPTLRSIKLSGCNASANVSAMRIVVEQESYGNDHLQLLIHFWEMEVLEIFRKMVQKEGLASKNVRQLFR